jgi:hypothetical protein
LTAPEAALAASSRGRPHLGPRVVVTAALWQGLEHLVDQARGSLDRSPFLADLLACHVERPDLIRHRQLTLQVQAGLTDVGESARPAAGTRHCTVRVHPAIAAELITRAQESGLPRAVYNATAIAELLGSGAVRMSTTQEGLPLAM